SDRDAAQPGMPRFSLALEGSLNHLSARLQCTYGERVVTVGLAADTFSYRDPQNPQRRLARNLPAECEALERLTCHGFTGPDAAGQFTLKGERAILSFFARELPRMEREWRVSLGARFSNVA